MADSGNAELLALLAEMKKSMEAGQEEMRIEQEEMKKRMEKEQDEMRVHIETQVEGIKEHVNTCIGKIEDVQSVKREINEVKSEVQEKISVLEKRLCDLEEIPINSLPSSGVIYSRPTVKPLTSDEQTSWSVFKTQFDVVSSSNGWTDRVKASQLVASLRGSAAEVLQGIPAGNLTDLTTIERALESRLGDSHLTQFNRTELKTRRQKPGESLQVLAADVERLIRLAYAECPLNIRESLAAQYFVDAIRDEDTQRG
ncbi:CCHC-type domain-containing protein [Nephila pilipes]|uniref:CCHC-type domain-containing protein n=1 Tax=Nephila pilipes TaxID=299642 RepID=A0A8X6NBY2_NEPPI|nr:CCHC-type domain-containing protein [Nephila pilipes]